VISVVCLTPVERCDFGHMPDSGRKIWLWSYIPTLVTLLDSG
jgi:hypothetical protein